ncbi:MAG: non-hydrolyzing UDP-N-acetylglucosamine 2-epimerase [Candidatus Latescibacterota bacterium]
MKIICVAGARPNFMKIAPLMRAFRCESGVEAMLVHTGQHYDEKMSDLFFRQLDIPEPDINLGCGGGSHARQTAAIMTAFEPVVLEHRPDAVLVVGDVNSTIACGMVAVKLGVKLIHVEAGLRSHDRMMPEEINRLLTDSISDLLFCTEQSGVDNLRQEGVAGEKIHLVGNVMIDTLLKNREKAEATTILKDMGLRKREYAVVTLHRPANVDDPKALAGLVDVLDAVQMDMPVVFPIHPRTSAHIVSQGLATRIAAMKNLHLFEPVGYLEFLKLMANARIVLTDSGGIQEETTILKAPCLTLRDNTERPITCELGSNRLAGTKPENIINAYREVMSNGCRESRIPPLWDGHAAERIVKVIIDRFGMGSEGTN